MEICSFFKNSFGLDPKIDEEEDRASSWLYSQRYTFKILISYEFIFLVKACTFETITTFIRYGYEYNCNNIQCKFKIIGRSLEDIFSGSQYRPDIIEIVNILWFLIIIMYLNYTLCITLYIGKTCYYPTLGRVIPNHKYVLLSRT